MRCFLSVTLILLLGLSLSAQETNPTKGATILWEKTMFDFGDIVQGDKVTHAFKFVNSGNEPLIITNIEVTCGCTIPKGWPRDPILPGDKGEIEVQFNSSGKFGRQNKVVTIVSNAAAGNSQVTFTANILEKKMPN